MDEQLKAMEARLVEEEACIEYSNPLEPTLHNEHEDESHLEIVEEIEVESLKTIFEVLSTWSFSWEWTTQATCVFLY